MGIGEAGRPKVKPMGAGDSRSAAQEGAGLLSGTAGPASRKDADYPGRKAAPQDAHVARLRRSNIEVRPSSLGRGEGRVAQLILFATTTKRPSEVW